MKIKSENYINWPNTLFLFFTPIVGILGTIYLYVSNNICWQTCLLAVFMTIATGFSITAGYHRLFAHCSYKCSNFVKFCYLMFGAASFEGSALEWSTDHRNHHRYVDTERDPYNINQGFWHAHIGWLLHLKPHERNFSNVADLEQNILVKIQHKFCVTLGILFGFILPMIIASLWGDMLGGLVIAGALRIVFNHHVTFAINSICHTFGKKTYSNKQTARDNWFTALFTYGEGYHSYHHKFPIDYRNGIKYYHYDPTKWLIKLLSWLKLARDLKTVSEHRILKQMITVKELMLSEKIAKIKLPPQAGWLQVTDNLQKSINSLLKKVEKYELSYAKLKNKYSKHDKAARIKLKVYKKQLKLSCLEFKSCFSLYVRNCDYIVMYGFHLDNEL